MMTTACLLLPFCFFPTREAPTLGTDRSHAMLLRAPHPSLPPAPTYFDPFLLPAYMG